MLEKLKYYLSQGINPEQIRVRCVAVMCAVTIAVVTLLGLSVNTVKIFDGEKTYVVRSLNMNVASVLATVKLKSDRYEIKNTTVDNRLTTVEIAYSYPVYVTVGEQTKEISFTGGTVADALKLAGYTPNEYDFVEPSLETVIEKTAYIDYTDIEYVNGNYTEAIPYTIDKVYTASQSVGYKKTEKGANGLKQVSYTEKLVNGISEGKTVTDVQVLKEAVNGKEVIGTKVSKKDKNPAVTTSASVKSVSTLKPSFTIELDKNGIPVNYKSKRIARATAYTYTGNNCSTGVAPQPGYIAVNPKVIPYGTKMYIRTPDGSVIYGYAVAADTGGFIRRYPTGVDLFMSSKSACTSFGVRNVEIYILE